MTFSLQLSDDVIQVRDWVHEFATDVNFHDLRRDQRDSAAGDLAGTDRIAHPIAAAR
ncbi:hypothetical protein [Mycobacterium gastri]|uniref:hypothetical protein n=1 Tax=Mycobacterium gastri TaxID=1777 RepID=UPI0003E4DF3B|nr:hypothetical protein [Mycobacterium gastri]ETW22376.1 hypothetical protein MGAST_20405 [Mycobacterium gastri 'Wayne']